MGKVLFTMTMSLDGFIAGPNDELERLHDWILQDGGPTGKNREVLDEIFKTIGAFVIGRRMFNIGQGLWGENPPFHLPVFVLTHETREKMIKEGGTTYTFVTHGIENTLHQARAAAGDRAYEVVNPLLPL